MSDARKNEIKALHNLLDTAVDGRKGYAQAIEKCTDASAPLKAYLSDAQHGCTKAAQEIRDILRSYGEKADDDGTISGAMHRGWIATRTTFSPDAEAAFVSEIVRGEEHAVKSYEKALEQIATPHVRSEISEQLQGLRQNLTKAKTFQRSMSEA